MNITASTINISPIQTEAAQFEKPLERSCISGFERIEIVITSDLDKTAPIPEITLQLFPALFVTPAISASTSSSVGYSALIPASSANSSTFILTWDGNERENNYYAVCQIFNTGTSFWEFRIAIEFQNTSDLSNFVTTSLVAYQLGRLLNSNNANTINLSNLAGSVYNSVRRLGVDCLLTETGQPTAQKFLSVATQLSWYDSIVQPIINNGITQTNLFSRQPNLIDIEYTILNGSYSPATWTLFDPVIMLVKQQSSTDPTLNWAESYEISCKNITATPSSYPTTNWSGFDQNDKIKTTGGATWTVNPASPDYICSFDIDETLLSANEKYRIIVLVQIQNTADDKCYHYANISDELTVTDELEPADPTKTDEIEIYFEKKVANWVELSGQQRVVNRTILDGTNYNTVRGAGEFIARANTVKVQTSYDETIGANIFRHVMEEVAITRNASNQWVTQGGLVVTQDTLTQILTCEFTHRLRYEANLQNLYSINITNPAAPVILPTPTGNMDMQGKQINVIFTLTCISEDEQDTDEFMITHYLTVDDYDLTALTLTAVDEDGDPITQLCDGIDTICVKSVGGGINPALSLIDKEIYGVSNIKEFDGGTAGASVSLTQIQEAPLISSDPAFVANEHFACMDAQQFDLGRKYRYSIVTYKNPVCDNPYAAAYIQAVIDGGETLSIARQNLICNFFNALDDCEVTTKIHFLHLLSANSVVASLINAVNPGTYDATAVNGIDTLAANPSLAGWYPDKGFKGDGLSYTLNLGWTQPDFDISGDKFSQMTGIWVDPANVPSINFAALLGRAGGLTLTDDWLQVWNQSYLYEDIAAEVIASPNFGSGFLAYQAESFTTVQNIVYKNGVLVAGAPLTTANPIAFGAGAQTPPLGGTNQYTAIGSAGGNFGIFPAYSDVRLFIDIGTDALTADEHLCLYNAINYYLTNLAANT